MITSGLVSEQSEFFDIGGPRALAITDGEINYFWSFIQGSIMIPEVWKSLLHGYGFCERHAWIHLSIEMSFRDRYLLGPAILYGALIEKSLRAIHSPRRLGSPSFIRRLRSGPCFLCGLNIIAAGAGAASQERLDRGRDSSRLSAFAVELEPLWRAYVCKTCAGDGDDKTALNRCRQHLLSDAKARTSIDFPSQVSMLRELSERVTRYESSFLFGGGEASDRDRAAFISAVGWCSGWRPLLALLQ
jgi:hypothetical protein